jgi:hypothetical protein
MTVSEVLADGAAYHEKKVVLKGFLHLEFENVALYDDKEIDLEYGAGPHIWVEQGGNLGAAEYNRKWVLLEGTFTFGPSGHMGAFPGMIRDITRVVVLRSRDAPADHGK